MRDNSAYKMIKRALEQCQAVECVLFDSDVTIIVASKKLLLENRNQIYLDDVQKILKPFFIATSLTSNESQSTILIMMSIVPPISENFPRLDDDDTPSIEI